MPKRESDPPPDKLPELRFKQPHPTSPKPTSPCLATVSPSRNAMMYNASYQWPGAQAGMYNPYMTGYHPMLQGQGMMPQMQGHPMSGQPSPMPQREGDSEELLPFDSSKMKAGRLGHYGYLEGRELAGPPVGYLPAGMQPQTMPPRSGSSMQSQSVSPALPSPSGTQPAPSMAYYDSTPSASAAGSHPASAGMMWGDPGNVPRARYDGG